MKCLITGCKIGATSAMSPVISFKGLAAPKLDARCLIHLNFQLMCESFLVAPVQIIASNIGQLRDAEYFRCIWLGDMISRA